MDTTGPVHFMLAITPKEFGNYARIQLLTPKSKFKYPIGFSTKVYESAPSMVAWRDHKAILNALEMERFEPNQRNYGM